MVGTRTALVRSASTLCFWLIARAAIAQSIEGTATYREHMALPPGAIFEAALEDASRADAPEKTIARTRFLAPRNPPIIFTLTYDLASVLPQRRFVVRARILLAGTPLFVTDGVTPIMPDGSVTRVTIDLRRVSVDQIAPPAPPVVILSPSLAGTTWRLVRFLGSDGTTLTPDDRSRYIIEFSATGRLTTRIDCNGGNGTWTSGGPNQLQFGPLALTRAQCPPESLHDQIVKQWSDVRSYVVRDGHLFLELMADGGVYQFEPAVTPAP